MPISRLYIDRWLVTPKATGSKGLGYQSVYGIFSCWPIAPVSRHSPCRESSPWTQLETLLENDLQGHLVAGRLSASALNVYIPMYVAYHLQRPKRGLPFRQGRQV